MATVGIEGLMVEMLLGLQQYSGSVLFC